MPRRCARWSLALALGAALVAGAPADDEKPKEKPKPKLPPEMKKCLDACVACAKALQAAGMHANEKYKDGEKKYLPPLRWIYDCGETTVVAAHSLARQGPGHRVICEACAKLCDGCAKACKGFDDDELKECAKKCAACAKACREFLKGQKKEKKDDRKASVELAPVADVTLKRGGEATVTVKVTRRNVNAELTVTFRDLPEGVAVKDVDPKIEKGAKSAKFTLIADKELAKHASQVVKVTVGSRDRKQKVTNSFKVTVKVTN
jgi:hypothetical protein